jgi:phage baseplate assembly protein V
VAEAKLMFRVGIVAAQDAVNCRVRVTFQSRDEMLSYWLPVLVAKSQNDKFYYLPDIGELVVCLMDPHDEDGCVLGAIYSSTDTPAAGTSADHAQIKMKDGAVFDYNRATHDLAVTLPAGGTLSITANGATIAIDASGNVSLTAAGNINLITSAHTESVNNIVNTYNTHTHSDPQGGNTGVPTQQLA